MNQRFKNVANRPFEGDFVARPVCHSYHVLTKPAVHAGFRLYVQEVIHSKDACTNFRNNVINISIKRKIHYNRGSAISTEE